MSRTWSCGANCRRASSATCSRCSRKEAYNDIKAQLLCIVLYMCCAVALIVRPKMFLDRAYVYNMVLGVNRGIEQQSFAMLWLASYQFMLRVPSEAVPMMRGGDAVQGHSVLFLESDNCVVLRLKSRKNRPQGATIKRFCSCKQDSAEAHPLCCVHSLWHGFFAHLQPGEQPWAGLAPGAVNTHLRRTLTRLEVQFGQHFHLACSHFACGSSGERPTSIWFS